jgi:hypothetical protein
VSKLKEKAERAAEIFLLALVSLIPGEGEILSQESEPLKGDSEISEKLHIPSLSNADIQNILYANPAGVEKILAKAYGTLMPTSEVELEHKYRAVEALAKAINAGAIGHQFGAEGVEQLSDFTKDRLKALHQ